MTLISLWDLWVNTAREEHAFCGFSLEAKHFVLGPLIRSSLLVPPDLGKTGTCSLHVPGEGENQKSGSSGNISHVRTPLCECTTIVNVTNPLLMAS